MFCKNLKMSLPLYDFYMVLNASFFWISTLCWKGVQMKKKAKEKGNMTVSWASVHSELFFFAALSTKLPPSFLKGFYLRSSTTSAPIIRSSKTEKKTYTFGAQRYMDSIYPPPPPHRVTFAFPWRLVLGSNFPWNMSMLFLVFFRLRVGGRSKIWMFPKIVGFSLQIIH